MKKLQWKWTASLVKYELNISNHIRGRRNDGMLEPARSLMQSCSSVSIISSLTQINLRGEYSTWIFSGQYDNLYTYNYLNTGEMMRNQKSDFNLHFWLTINRNSTRLLVYVTIYA